MILGPAGLENRRDVWFGVSLLAPHVRYTDHSHAPEETYLVLSDGEFRQGDGDWFTPGRRAAPSTTRPSSPTPCVRATGRSSPSGRSGLRTKADPCGPISRRGPYHLPEPGASLDLSAYRHRRSHLARRSAGSCRCPAQEPRVWEIARRRAAADDRAGDAERPAGLGWMAQAGGSGGQGGPDLSRQCRPQPAEHPVDRHPVRRGYGNPARRLLRGGLHPDEDGGGIRRSPPNASRGKIAIPSR